MCNLLIGEKESDIQQEVAIKHEGLHAHRLRPDRGNPREQVFAKLWAKENGRPHTRHQLLAYLLHSDTDGLVQYWNLTQEEATIAATGVQWLGSNVGWSFLLDRLEECGYEIVERPT